MLIFLAIAIIIISLIIILFIILKKFPALSIIDVDKTPQEKESQFKEKIIRQRLERDLSKISVFISKIWHFLNKLFSTTLASFYQRLKKIKDGYLRNKKISFKDKQEKINSLVNRAQQAIKEEDYKEAENSLIDTISLDDKNIKCFLILGSVYYEQKNYQEALTTWQHTLKLFSLLKKENDDLGVLKQEILFELALASIALDSLDQAQDYLKEVLDIEPNNPRFLDLIFDLSIMKKDKEKADIYYQRLMDVNPENMKLVDLKRQIDDLE